MKSGETVVAENNWSFVQIRLEQQVKEELTSFAKKRGMTVSGLFRLFITRLLDKPTEHWEIVNYDALQTLLFGPPGYDSTEKEKNEPIAESETGKHAALAALDTDTVIDEVGEEFKRMAQTDTGLKEVEKVTRTLLSNPAVLAQVAALLVKTISEQERDGT